MEKIIAACGNDCKSCPRHMPKTDVELSKAAQLWYRIGYRNQIVSNQEIQCMGCSPEHWCRYHIAECAKKHEKDNCGECPEYPCHKINETFKQTMAFKPSCKLQCYAQEYESISRAFFEKKDNLDEVAKDLKEHK